MAENKKTPQDVRNQGEYYRGSCIKLGRVNDLTLKTTALCPKFCMHCGNQTRYFRMEDQD